MNYFNFFSQYSGGKQETGDGKKLLLAISAIAIVLCVGFYGFTLFRCFRYQAQLDYLNEIKTNQTFIEQHAAAIKVSSKIGGAEKELSFMEKLELYADTVSTLNTDLLDLINNCVITGAYVSETKLEGTELELKGYAVDLDTIITIEENFRNSGKFSNILMRTIGKDTGGSNLVVFQCLLQLDGGAILSEQG